MYYFVTKFRKTPLIFEKIIKVCILIPDTTFTFVCLHEVGNMHYLGVERPQSPLHCVPIMPLHHSPALLTVAAVITQTPPNRLIKFAINAAAQSLILTENVHVKLITTTHSNDVPHSLATVSIL